MRSLIPKNEVLAQCLFEAIAIAEQHFGVVMVARRRGDLISWYIPGQLIWFDFHEQAPPFGREALLWTDSSPPLTIRDFDFACEDGWLCPKHEFRDDLEYRRLAFVDLKKHVNEDHVPYPDEP